MDRSRQDSGRQTAASGLPTQDEEWRFARYTMKQPMQSICVYCGSSFGRQPEYTNAARQLGTTIAQRDLTLVYGGSNVGLMGAMADAALEAGGEVVGVIPQSLAERIAHPGLSELFVVDTMHQRKAKMLELAGGCVALPGGIGTWEEMLEVLTWAQLGLHRKPCGLLNVCGYYDKFLEFFDHAVEQDFVKPPHRAMLVVAPTAEELLTRMQTHPMPSVKKWGDRLLDVE